jgi:hypothetical protein
MRSRSNVINDDNYYEFMVDIGNDIIKNIISSLSEIYTARYVPVKELNYLAYNTMSISIFLDTTYSKLYVTYKLDEGRKEALRYSDKYIYRRVNNNLRYIQRDQDLLLSVVGEPSNKKEYIVDYNKYKDVHTDLWKPLRMDTEFLWYVIPGPKNNKQYPLFLDSRQRLKDNIRKNNMHPKDVQKYINKVVEINKTYLSNTSNLQIERAFNKYINLNKTTFDYTPRIVEEWRGFTIYIDITHNTEAEKLNSIDHNYGELLHPERIPQYIRDWAIIHGKRV